MNAPAVAVHARLARRRAATVAAVSAFAVALLLARALLSDYTVSVVDAVRILGGANLPPASFILLEATLPAALAGTLAGAAFGVGGGAFQAMLRNPLASPDLIGVTGGSSAAAVAALVLFHASGSVMALAAFAGGLSVAAGIHLLAGHGRHASNRVILVGIGISASLTAVVQWLLIRANTHQAHDAMVWLSGSLHAITWDGIARMALVCALALPALFLLGRRLTVLQAGDDAAGALGVRPQAVRLQIMVAVVLLSATATSVCGPIAFVGLLAGPIARALLGGRTSLPLAAAVGAALVPAADYAGAFLLPGGPYPVGVVTGLLGAPVILAHLVSTPRQDAP